MNPIKTLRLSLALALGAVTVLPARPIPTPGKTLGQELGWDHAAPASPAAAVSATATVSPAAAVGAVPAPLFPDPGTAVAYQVGERLFGHENHVVGRNRAVTVTVEAKGEQRRVVVSALDGGFKTDRSMRDGRVAGYLGGGSRSVVVASGWFPAVSLTALAQGEHSLDGILTLRGHSAPVTLNAQGSDGTVLVTAVTSFKDLGLDPPSIFLMGSVHQPLTLSAQIRLKDVQGLEP